METSTETLEIEGIKGELLVTYDYEIIKLPKRIECFYGEHEFNEDEINCNITSVELVIKGVGIDVTKLLSEQQKEEIKNGLNIW